MKTKAFGSTGTLLPVIGQGTWNAPESGARAEQARRAIRRGIELGMTHIDTAEMYGAGRVEELLGEAIAGLPRETLFVTTKVLPGNAEFRGTLRAADRSLKRLRLEYVDLFMLHWPGDHPIEETMRALERLVEDGKTRFVGVSNFDVDEMLEAAVRSCATCRLRAIKCSTICASAASNIDCSGRARTRHRDRCLYAVRARTVSAGADGRGRRRSTRVARKHGATPRQVILAFLTRESNVFTIPKASTSSTSRRMPLPATCTLDAADVAAIDAAFPRGARVPLASL